MGITENEYICAAQCTNQFPEPLVVDFHVAVLYQNHKMAAFRQKMKENETKKKH